MFNAKKRRYPGRHYPNGYHQKRSRRKRKPLVFLCLSTCAVLFGLAYYLSAHLPNRLQPLFDQAQAIYGEIREEVLPMVADELRQIDFNGRLRDFLPGNETPPVTGDYDLVGKVIEVKDGDSLILRSNPGRRSVEIRLDGIDTPEWDQNWGRQAERALSGMVNRKQVGVLTAGTDTYGRTLGTLYHDGENINLRMVAEGHAWWYRHYAANKRHLAEAEATARAQGLGLWQEKNPIPPWDWRRYGR